MSISKENKKSLCTKEKKRILPARKKKQKHEKNNIITELNLRSIENHNELASNSNSNQKRKQPLKKISENFIPRKKTKNSNG